MEKSNWRPMQDDWDKEHTTRLNLKLNNNTDKDILDALDMSKKQGSIKELIRLGLKMKGMIDMSYNLKDYIEAVKQFIEDSKDWNELDIYKFYTSDKNCWSETSDNAHGGLDVSWAFHKEPNFEEIRGKYIELLKNQLDTFVENDVKNIEISFKNLD